MKKTILHTIDGSVVFHDEVDVLGVVTGTLTVARGGHVTLEGMVMGDLVVLEGGRADVNGTVMGFVINDGGAVKMRGIDGVLGSAGVLPPYTSRHAGKRPSFWG